MSDSLQAANAKNLVIFDLDGTLIYCNSLHREIRSSITKVGWLGFIGAVLASRSFSRSSLKVLAHNLSDKLDYSSCVNTSIFEVLQETLDSGNEPLIASAAYSGTVSSVLKSLGIKINYLASTDHLNLKGEAKAQAIRRFAGQRQFAYFGDSVADLAVFKVAQRCVLVGNNERALTRARSMSLSFEHLNIDTGVCNHRLFGGSH